MAERPDLIEAKAALDHAKSQLSDHVDQFQKDRDKTQDLAYEWLKSWTLSLGLANAGGLATLGSALIRIDKIDLWLATLPSMWAFAVGLVFSGVMPFAQSQIKINMARTFGLLHRNSKHALTGKLSPTYDIDRAESKKHSSKVPFWHRVNIACGAISCSAFICGMFWPLIVLTFRIKIP
jgi:hypothetical protein